MKPVKMKQVRTLIGFQVGGHNGTSIDVERVKGAEIWKMEDGYLVINNGEAIFLPHANCPQGFYFDPEDALAQEGLHKAPPVKAAK